MAYWKSRGLRGNAFEEIINITNDKYNKKNIAIIQKIPTSIRPINVDNKTGTISLAYFEQKSTVDYVGVTNGLPFCFDAKETSQKNLALQNIHKHQVEFMESYQKQKGIAFFLIKFALKDETYFFPFDKFKIYWSEAQNGGKKSIPYEAFDKNLIVRSESGFILHYLKTMNKIL